MAKLDQTDDQRTARRLTDSRTNVDDHARALIPTTPRAAAAGYGLRVSGHYFIGDGTEEHW
jgi:hypothetical protein